MNTEDRTELARRAKERLQRNARVGVIPWEMCSNHTQAIWEDLVDFITRESQKKISAD